MDLGDVIIKTDGTRWLVVWAITCAYYRMVRIPEGETELGLGRTWDMRAQPTELVPWESGRRH